MDIVEMYQSGMSARDIASIVGTYHTKIYQILKNNGVTPRSKKEALQKHARYNTCVICGKTFRARENWKETRKSDRKTCSRECLSRLLSDNQKGSKGNNWKGGHSQAHYERIRKTVKLQVCEICGTTEGRLDTHHKDRDKSNNTVDNIMVLCASCHARLHYEEDDRGLKGWKYNNQ